MNEEPKSIWKKSWKGRRWLRAWLIVVAVTFLIALIVYLSGGIPGGPPSLWPELFFLLTGSLMTATVFVGLWAFIRWLCCRRNFKRFLFGGVCFITLIALFYAEEDWRGWHAWQKFKHEWEAKGEKFDFKDFAPPPVPDDQNFALTPVVASSYAAVLDKTGHEIIPRNTNIVDRLGMAVSYDNNSPISGIGNWQKSTLSDLKVWQQYYRTLAAKTNEFPIAPQPQSPADDVLLALSKYDSSIEELRQASQMPYSRFPLEYDKDDPAAILLPHLAALKRCSQVLQLRAIAELQDGQTEKAFDDVKLALSLADSIRTEPFIITHLVRIAILQIALQPVWEGLTEHKWSDAQLAALDSELAKLDFPADYASSIRSERADHIKLTDYLEQKRSRFWEFLNLISSDDNNRQPNVINNLFPAAKFYLMPKGWFYQNELVFAQMYQQYDLPMVDIVNQTVSPKIVLQTKNALESSLRPSPFNFFGRLLLPGYGNYAKRTAYGQNTANLARMAIALERYRLAHGGFPESLDALAPLFMEKIPHDIINGEPLRYRRTAGGQFVLYSVGWNETDDDGKVGLNKDGAVDRDTGDWVWRYPSK